MKQNCKTNRLQKPVYFLFIFCMIISMYANAQEKNQLRNTVKINLTTSVLYNNAVQFSFERLTGTNQSLSVFAGYNEFPANLSLNLDNTNLSNQNKKSGYMLGAEYRFYMLKENKYSPPHGIYLGPYMSLYQFTGDRKLIHTDSTGMQSDANLSTHINFFNVGAEMGYQFVFGRRWVLDAIVFGPALTHYDFKAKLDNNLPDFDENEAIKKVIDAIKEKFPLLNDLSGDHSVNHSGNEAFWSFGFRYSVSVGFRF